MSAKVLRRRMARKSHAISSNRQVQLTTFLHLASLFDIFSASSLNFHKAAMSCGCVAASAYEATDKQKSVTAKATALAIFENMMVEN